MGGGDLSCCYREQIAYSLYSKFREPRLYRAAGRIDDWDTIPARCHSHPKEAAFVHKFAPNDTALHRIFRVVALQCYSVESLTAVSIQEKRLAAVSALLSAHRQAAATRDGFLRTPLHLACMDSSLPLTSADATTAAASAAAVQSARLILDHHPLAACWTDVEKRTPLHFLVARNDHVSPEFLQELIRHSPQAVHLRDAVGESPLDIVRRRQEEMVNAVQVLDILHAVAVPGVVAEPAVVEKRHNASARSFSRE